MINVIPCPDLLLNHWSHSFYCLPSRRYTEDQSLKDAERRSEVECTSSPQQASQVRCIDSSGATAPCDDVSSADEAFLRRGVSKSVDNEINKRPFGPTYADGKEVTEEKSLVGLLITSERILTVPELPVNWEGTGWSVYTKGSMSKEDHTIEGLNVVNR